MDIKHVRGNNKGKITMFALSTCVWCKRTKKLLNELGVEYDYIDVDRLDEDQRSKALTEMTKFNPSGSFPTLVINNNQCIVGYDADSIKEALNE